MSNVFLQYIRFIHLKCQIKINKYHQVLSIFCFRNFSEHFQDGGLVKWMCFENIETFQKWTFIKGWWSDCLSRRLASIRMLSQGVFNVIRWWCFTTIFFYCGGDSDAPGGFNVIRWCFTTISYKFVIDDSDNNSINQFAIDNSDKSIVCV